MTTVGRNQPGFLTVRGAGIALGMIVLVFALDLQAYQANVESDSILQLYTVRGPWGRPVLARNRLTHALRLDVLELPTPRDKGAWYKVQVQLRLDGDFGIRGRETDPSSGMGAVPGLTIAPVDVTYASFEGRALLGGTTGVELGRQIVIDSLGWWSFDGAKIAFSPKGLFEIYAFGGTEQRGQVPWLATDRYESDGVWRGDRDGLEPSMWPGYLDSHRPAPAYGGGVSLLAIDWLDARVDYRRVLERDRVVTMPFLGPDGELETYSGTRISSELAGLEASLRAGEWGWLDGGAVYDGYRGLVTEHRALAQANVGAGFRPALSYYYSVPRFDGDSIFNWFVTNPSLRAEAQLDWSVTSHTQLTGLVGRRFSRVAVSRSAEEPLVMNRQTEGNWLLGVDARTGRHPVRVALGNHIEVGDLGNLAISDISCKLALFGGSWEGLTMASLAHAIDSKVRERSGTYLAYVLGIRTANYRRPMMGLEWEHSTDGEGEHRFRVVGRLAAGWP